MLCELSINTDASTCASGDSGMCTAIWSPSKSALSAVQQHRMLANHIFENVPHHRFLRFHQFLGLLDRGAVSRGFQLVIDERLEKLKRHLLRQSALVQLQFGTN